ncbi:MAG: hypothetical protein AAFP87_20415 [Pseudomonadota bacterium]
MQSEWLVLIVLILVEPIDGISADVGDVVFSQLFGSSSTETLCRVAGTQAVRVLEEQNGGKVIGAFNCTEVNQTLSRSIREAQGWVPLTLGDPL